jgi:hypothetical protein
MAHFQMPCWAAVLTWVVAFSPIAVSAQEDDTLSISGSFRGYGGTTNINGVEYPGACGQDLAEVHAHNESHGWTLTLHGVTYSYDYYYVEWYDEFGGVSYQQQFTTGVHATSFEIQFVGADAEVLNEVVSAQLTAGSLTGGAVLELINGDYYDAYYGYSDVYTYWNLGLVPGPDPGVSFFANSNFEYGQLPADEFGFPAVVPQRLYAYSSTITDNREGVSGGLPSYGDVVDIGSTEPPYLPPIPPPPPTMVIEDGSVLEGGRGNKSLLLKVSISRVSSDPVSVQYRTMNGTATKKDYVSANCTVVFLPGEVERTIAVTIKGDRQREPNETFTVQLSNPVGATINDGLATATILTDD